MTPIRTIYLSGVHSGPNPSPGLGTARSLRLARPDLQLVAVDYSRRSSGLHWQGFDDAIVLPDWEQVDLSAHAAHIEELLAGGDALWISGLDLEAGVLSDRELGSRCVVPPPKAIKAAAKPPADVALRLGFSCPPHRIVRADQVRALEFIERTGWPVWVKGRAYEATRARDWWELEKAVAETVSMWGDPHVLIQAHVAGAEESIIFSAWEGRLLGAAWMTKTAVTAKGKTWGATMSPLDDDTREALADLVGDVGWHGGGEVELVRSRDEQLFVIDVNPRFPAWVHGATLSGLNLPALLVAGAESKLDQGHIAGSAVSGRFSRVVIEIPAAPHLSEPPPRVAREDMGQSLASKHPSAMPALSRRIAPAAGHGELIRAERRVERSLQAAREHAERSGSSPASFFDHDAFRERLAEVNRLASVHSWRLAYSIKTNPAPSTMGQALEAGWYAEATTVPEVEAAVRVGWREHDVILNGPAKWWTPNASALPAGLHTVFCDSLEELDDLMSLQGRRPAELVGLRLRPPGLRSRFGIDLDVVTNLRLAAEALRGEPFAVHVHAPQSRVGMERWTDLALSVVHLAAALQELNDSPVEMLDLGGGFTSDGLGQLLDGPDGQTLQHLVTELLPGCRLVVLEPGRAVLAPCGWVITEVLRADHEGVVVDASIAELPDRPPFGRRIYLFRNGTWWELPWGAGTVHGRTCMEADLLASEVDLSNVRRGDSLAMSDAGAYDVSMRYSFGQGGAPT